MNARVIYSHVPQWYGESENFLRIDLERFLTRVDAERYREEIASASPGRLRSLWQRLPYVHDAEELFSPDWSLGVEPLTIRELLRAAGSGRPLPCGLSLELECTGGWPRRSALLGAVPWLKLLRDPDTHVLNLQRLGWELFRCSSPDRAHQLQRQVKEPLVRCQVLGGRPAGSETR